MSGRNWLAKPHLQMYEDIHDGPGVNAGESTMSYYDEANKALQEVHKDISDGLKALSANWTGSAADGAAATARASAEWAGAASVATIVARAQSTHQASAYVDARNAMPEPVSIPDISPGRGIPATSVLVDVVMAQAKAAEAHQRAADVMAGYESSTARFVTAMPAYPEVPATAVTTSVIHSPSGETTSAPAPVSPPTAGSPNTATTQAPPGSPLTPAQRPTAVQPPGGVVEAAAPWGESNQIRPTDHTTATAALRSMPSSPGLLVGQPDPQNLTNTTPKPPHGHEPGDSHGRQPVAGITAGPPGDRFGGGRANKDSGRSAPPLTAQQPATSARSLPGTQAGARTAGGAPGLFPATANARSEDKDHERKYIVLDDQHLTDDHPPLAPPVIGEDQV